MAPRENESNAYAKFWGDKQRALWYMLWYFLEWSIAYHTLGKKIPENNQSRGLKWPKVSKKT